MLQILVPNNNHSERAYTLKILFKEFLALKYELIWGEQNDYILTFSDKTIIIRDHFFSLFPHNLSYLCKEAIPTKVSWDSTHSIPFLYGTNSIDFQHNSIICDADIFGASFFMLSRFEEHVLTEKDQFDRFDENQSLSIKESFSHIPIVNEYALLLQKFLAQLKYPITSTKSFSILLTHDVDYLQFYNKFSVFFQRFYKCIFKYHNYPQAYKEIRSYFTFLLDSKHDPYNSFDELMQTSKQYGLTSHFFFIASNASPYDQDYQLHSKQVQNLLNNILEKGHKIGLHVGYDSFSNYQQICDEKASLTKFMSHPTFSRQHYLRFNITQTPRLLDMAGIQWDSSLGFSQNIGFRCGSCFSFSMFDILERKQLTIKQKPLLIMDTAFASLVQKDSQKHAKEKFFDIAKKVRQHNGELVILWHNSSVKQDKWPKLYSLYKDLIETMSPYSS